MTANVALTDTFTGFKDKTNELIVMTQAAGMATGNPIKLLDTTQSTSNTTGSIITAGGVGIAKDVTVGGSVNVHGNLHANGNITSDGSLTFGDAATDNVVFAADINSHIIPNTDDTYDLGSTGQRWRNVWLNGNIDLNDSDNILFGIGNDMTLYHDGTNSYITNATGALKVATETSGIAVSIGHTTSETTINDNLIVTGKINGPLVIGEDDLGHDVTFYGDTAGSFMLWDQSDDALELTDSTPIRIGDDAAGDMTLYHDGTNSYITNKTGALKLATETSGIAVTIGHATSETTIGHNLTISGNLTVSGTTTTVTTATIQMYDKNIEIGAVASPSDTTADGGGLTLKGASDKTITWVDSTDSWDFNQHIFPSADGTLDLGSSTKEWKDLYVDGIAYVDTINLNGTAITETAARINILATQGDAMAFSIALG